MNQAFDPFALIQSLVAIGPRLGENESKTIELLTEILAAHKIPYSLQPFVNTIPNCVHASLEADGRPVPCLGCSFVSGHISKESKLGASTFEDDVFAGAPSAIIYSPFTSAISLFEFREVPAVAVSREMASLLENAHEIKGEVTVEKLEYSTGNILVGNLTNPKAILFAHFDSFFGGGVDNASGTALLFHLIINNPNLLTDSLFVIAGSEELSYDEPHYWGHGYRVFEDEYKALLDLCEKIVIVDGVGVTLPMVDENKALLEQALPLKNIDAWKDKTTEVYSEVTAIFPFYHSVLDDGSHIRRDLFMETVEHVEKMLP